MGGAKASGACAQKKTGPVGPIIAGSAAIWQAICFYMRRRGSGSEAVHDAHRVWYDKEANDRNETIKWKEGCRCLAQD